MAGSSGYVYTIRMAPVAVTAIKTLIQVKAGAARLDIIAARVYQITKTSSEMLAIQILHKTVAATVTSATPLPDIVGGTASLAVGGTTATGTNASAEGTDGNVVDEGVWNILNGEYNILYIPEMRKPVPQGGIAALKLNTAPAASMTIGAILTIIEYA